MNLIDGNITLQLVHTEEDLINGCINNDRRLQKALYKKYCNAMYSSAYRILSDFDLANDALQEAFIQVFRDINKFRGDSTLGAWIKTIVVRTALRKLKNENFFIRLSESEYEVPFEISNPLSGDYLEKAILSLPDGFRTVFLLIEVEGYAHKEVAKMLNISEGTSKSQLHHAKRRLQKIISDLRFVN
ncbi:MAG: sigma-70 family RNA polymerase sigma factor [Bacteroidales bacterium]|nr:sigma-70 family RNA polymerase sigma factor [Bacteroidales bacterium]